MEYILENKRLFVSLEIDEVENQVKSLRELTLDPFNKPITT
jgi:hypothetical protein